MVVPVACLTLIITTLLTLWFFDLPKREFLACVAVVIAVWLLGIGVDIMRDPKRPFFSSGARTSVPQLYVLPAPPPGTREYLDSIGISWPLTPAELKLQQLRARAPASTRP